MLKQPCAKDEFSIRPLYTEFSGDPKKMVGGLGYYTLVKIEYERDHLGIYAYG